MKRIDWIIALVLLCSAAGIAVEGRRVLGAPVKHKDPREKEFVSLEMKRSGMVHAFRYVEERQYEEAMMLVSRESAADNPFALYLAGLILYRTGRTAEGLDKIKQSLQSSPFLYDRNYPNNIRAELEEILTAVAADPSLREYRHFIESKLKGGCG